MNTMKNLSSRCMVNLLKKMKKWKYSETTMLLLSRGTINKPLKYSMSLIWNIKLLKASRNRIKTRNKESRWWRATETRLLRSSSSSLSSNARNTMAKLISSRMITSIRIVSWLNSSTSMSDCWKTCNAKWETYPNIRSNWSVKKNNFKAN